MRLTIIETGQPPAGIRDDWPDYPAMFTQLLSPFLVQVQFETIALFDGVALPDPASLDAILITGSAAGVYDDMYWMQPLFDFIRAAAAAHVPQVGICFGHQALACALGARVAKSDKGWGIGRHSYDILSRPDWMNGTGRKQFSLGVSHQDQVLSLPPGATCVAASDFTPYAALDYPDAPAISFQGHPEFSPGFSCALYGIRRGTALPEHRVDEACDSLEQPIDNALVGEWIATFLRASLSSAAR